MWCFHWADILVSWNITLPLGYIGYNAKWPFHPCHAYFFIFVYLSFRQGSIIVDLLVELITNLHTYQDQIIDIDVNYILSLLSEAIANAQIPSLLADVIPESIAVTESKYISLYHTSISGILWHNIHHLKVDLQCTCLYMYVYRTINHSQTG